MSEELEQLRELARNMPDSKAKIPILEEIIRLAELENEVEAQYVAMDNLIQNSIYHSDSKKAIMILPKYLAVVDEHFHTIFQDPDRRRFIIHRLKSCLQAIDEFHQVDPAYPKMLEEECIKRSRAYGYSLRWYYCNKFEERISEEDPEGAKHYFQLYQQEPRDVTSHCRACEIEAEASYYLFINDYGKAMELAQILLTGEESCTHSLPNICHTLLQHYIRNKQMEEAGQIAQRGYRVIKNDDEFIYQIGTYFTYYALTNPKKGMTIYVRHLPWIIGNENGSDQFKFSLGALTLWKGLKQVQKTGKCRLNVPSELPFYREDGIYSIDEMIGYYQGIVENLAQKFKAQGQDYYTRMLQERETWMKEHYSA